MTRVAVLLASGFEEAEAIVTIDILRRLNIDVDTLACAESRAVVSYHDVPMVADYTWWGSGRTCMTRWCFRVDLRVA